MIDDLKPYITYRDSNVPWLGKVPNHWDATKVKRLARPGYKTFVDGDWIESPFIRSEGIRLIQTGNIGVGSYRDKGFRYIDEETFSAFGCTEIHPNDVLICRLGEPVGRACLAPTLGVRMITSVDVCILKTRETVLPSFTVYAMSSHIYLQWINSLVRGSTRDRVSRSMLGGFVVPLPPVSEQAAIVRFLDHADRLIRRFIRAKKKLIALLNEQKQAIIHQAVTRGLDPNVKFRPSGVTWLEDVPEHWTPVRLKTVASIQTGITLGKHYGLAPLVERPYLRVANVQAGSLNLSKVVSVKVPIAEAERSTLRSGDVLMTEGGDIDKLGRGCIWQGEIPDCLHQNHLFAVRTDSSTLDPKFLVALLASRHGRSYFEITAKKTTNLASTNSTTLGNFPLFLPDIAEQVQILDWIAEHTSTIDLAIGRAGREIDLLQEYRTRLIADVVTGKLDVRDAAAGIPEEIAELEPLDELEDAIEDNDLLDDPDLEETAMEARA